MILTCPNCGTQYAVKDGAIPAQGRKVRCASCGQSWHQDPETAEVRSEPVEAPPVPPAEPDVAASDSPYEAIPEPADERHEEETLAEAAMIEPRAGPEAEERAFQESVV